MIELTLLYFALRKKFNLRPAEFSYNRLDQAILDQERRFHWLAWTAIISLLLMACAMLYVRPGSHAVFLGTHYAELSRNPFAFDSANPVAYRFLTPLISYVIGLQGNLIIITNLLIGTALIGLVYRWFRENTPRPGDAIFGALSITFSLVILTTLASPGYCDLLTYVFIFLMWRYRERRVLFYALFFLGLLNRESIAFLTPWFIFITLVEYKFTWRGALDVIAGHLIVFAAYFLVRYAISLQFDIAFSTAYYLGPLTRDPFHWYRMTLPLQWMGVFSVFKLFWIFPALATLSFYQRGQKLQLWSMALLFACAYSQLFLAYDTSRMMSLSFMVMIIALRELFEHDTFQIRRWIGWVFVVNVFVPQYQVAADKMDSMSSFLVHGFAKLFL